MRERPSNPRNVFTNRDAPWSIDNGSKLPVRSRSSTRDSLIYCFDRGLLYSFLRAGLDLHGRLTELEATPRLLKLATRMLDSRMLSHFYALAAERSNSNVTAPSRIEVEHLHI